MISLNAMVKGIVVQFRRGRRVIHERHFLLDIGLISRDEAKKMAGKNVVWTSPAGNKIKGKVSDAHGNNGLVRAIFERGLPGQAVTSEIEILADLPVKKEKKVDDKKMEKKKEEVKEVKSDKKVVENAVEMKKADMKKVGGIDGDDDEDRNVVKGKK
jgi:large subunit ribosomal protein L35Ae